MHYLEKKIIGIEKLAKTSLVLGSLYRFIFLQVVFSVQLLINGVVYGICSVSTSWLMTMAELKPINGIQT